MNAIVCASFMNDFVFHHHSVPNPTNYLHIRQHLSILAVLPTQPLLYCVRQPCNTVQFLDLFQVVQSQTYPQIPLP
jgi:hypothetical protein